MCMVIQAVTKQVITRSLPLFLCGSLMIYLALVDQTLFQIILQGNTQSRLAVTIATVVAATIPMFLAVGLVKRGLLRQWQTIHSYEAFVKTHGFLLVSALYFLLMVLLMTLQGSISEPQGGVTATLSLMAALYLIYYSRSKSGRL